MSRMRNDERLKPVSNGERSRLVSGGTQDPRTLQSELITLHEWELALNQAILAANICFGAEPYLAAFDKFYADEVEVRNNDSPPVKGKQANRQMLASFLLPIHVVVEVGAATLHSFALKESWIGPASRNGAPISPVRSIRGGALSNGSPPAAGNAVRLSTNYTSRVKALI